MTQLVPLNDVISVPGHKACHVNSHVVYHTAKYCNLKLTSPVHKLQACPNME